MSDVSNAFVEKVLTELVRVSSGTSKFVNGAITFEMSKLPFAQLLQRFKADPDNLELLKMLPAAAFQDFGQRFSGFIKEAIDDLRRANGESIPLPVKPIPDSVFNQELYNQLSTILQYTIGRQLDQKQIVRLQFDTGRLAEVLTKQIDEQAKNKATEICKVLAGVIGAEVERLDNAVDELHDLVARIDGSLQGNFNAVDELREDMDLPVRRQKDVPHGPYDPTKEPCA